MSINNYYHFVSSIKSLDVCRISPAAFPGAMVFERNLHKQANRKMYDCGKDWMKDMEAGRMKGAYPSGMPLKQYPLVDSEAITTEDGSDDSELERVVFNNLPYFHEDFDQVPILCRSVCV